MDRSAVIVAVAIAVAVVLLAGTVKPTYSTEITVTGRVVDAFGQALSATVEAWQVSEYDRRAGTDNHWRISGWIMPKTHTNEDGRFTLRLRDYSQLQTHQYYLVVRADHPGHAPTGLYVTMTRYEDGEVLDLGQIAVNRQVP